MNSNCGIYKITSPSGRVYIGQSININNRFLSYKSLNSKTTKQVKLWRSFIKYGVENHQFDTIEYCEKVKLNESERFWQEQFDVLSKNGLNCVLTRTDLKKGEISENTRVKLSIATTGKNNPMFGKERTELWKYNHSNFMKGKYSGDKNPMYNKEGGMKNKTHTKESKKIMSDKQRLGNNPRARVVLNIVNGIFYNSIIEASEIYNINKHTLSAMLNGQNKNKTDLIRC